MRLFFSEINADSTSCDVLKMHRNSRVVCLLLFCFFFLCRLVETFGLTGKFENRTMSTQGAYQAAGTCVAIAFGLVGGVCVGEFHNIIFAFTWKDLFLF